MRVVELGGTGAIAIDGAPATGAEVRDKLGADADAVIQLSYLDLAQRRALFGVTAEAPAPPSSPAPPAIPEPSTAPIQPAPPPPIEPAERRRTRRGDQVRFGGNVRVDEDELVVGNVVAIGGSARIDGEVRGEVVAVGGNVELGPRSLVTEDIAVVGGTLERAEGSRVQGDLHEVGIGEIDFGDWRMGDWRPRMRGFSRTLAFMSTLGRVAILCVLGALVMLLGREYVERTSLRAAAEPLKAGAIGFLAQLLFLPVLIITIVILVVTIVGIPLLLLIPFALLALAVIALLGFTSIAYRVGQFVSERFGWGVSSPYAHDRAGDPCRRLAAAPCPPAVAPRWSDRADGVWPRCDRVRGGVRGVDDRVRRASRARAGSTGRVRRLGAESRPRRRRCCRQFQFVQFMFRARLLAGQGERSGGEARRAGAVDDRVRRRPSSSTRSDCSLLRSDRCSPAATRLPPAEP